MEINIKLAESLIDAFDSEDTAIILWDNNDDVIYRNKKTSERWIKLKLDFEIGQNFYQRIKKVVDLGLMADEEVQLRKQNYELAKSLGISQEFVLKGPTGRWVQIKDTPTSEGNMLTLMTNVTHIVEQDLERKRLSEAIENFPGGVMFWDENDQLIVSNRRNQEIMKQAGIDFILEKGIKYEQMLKKQVNSDLYVLPKGTSKLKYIKKRLQERAELKSRTREINLQNGTTIIANETRFDDGSLLSVYTDITDLKNKESQYKQLADALDNLPIPMLFWDKDDKLITSNKKSRDFHKKYSIKLDNGSTWQNLFENQLKKNIYVIPKNIDVKKFAKQRANSRKKTIK